MAMECLPDEILLDVLSWLPCWSLVCAAQDVCSRWRRLCQDHSLWKNAELDCDQVDPEVAVKTLAAAPALHCLRFGVSYSTPSQEILKAVVDSPASVTVFHFLPLEFDADLVLQIIRRLSPNLEDLTLRVSRHLSGLVPDDDDHDGVSPLLEVLSHMPRLRSLRLLGTVPRGWADGWASLEHLDIRQSVIVARFAERFCLALLEATKGRLKTLLMPRYMTLSTSVLTKLSQCRGLTYLAPCRLEDLLVLHSLPCLEELLAECDLYDERRHGAIVDLTGLQKISNLSLRIGDELGAEVLARACPNVSDLTLRGTINSWAVRIATNTPRVRRLRIIEPTIRLCLGTADPMSTRCRILLEVVKILPDLQVLDVRFSFQRRPLKPAVLENILECRPGLRVLSSHEDSGEYSSSSEEDEDDSDHEVAND